MTAGPSKKQLAEYFRNNRLYFDSLANQYKDSDPEYYNEYIAPFYSNPFHASGSRRNPLRLVVMTVGLTISLAVAGIVLFMTSETRSPVKIFESSNDDDIQTDGINLEKYKVDPSSILDTLSSVQKLDNFQKGMTYFSIGDYDKAEVYFSQVEKDNIFYSEARKKLSEIRKKKLEKDTDRSGKADKK